MSELVPTRTEHEPTATERLRALLDERGVEWDYGITGPTTTRFRVNGVNGVDLTFTPMRDGLLCSTILTPEQAIAASLGQEDIYTREDMEGAFVSGYSLGSLPVGSDPRWDENRQTVDEHMAELGWVRKEAATLDDSDATEARQRDAVEVVRCRDCEHSLKDGTLCQFFASWVPIAGGDEYAEMPADVEPDGFCAWASRKESE